MDGGNVTDGSGQDSMCQQDACSISSYITHQSEDSGIALDDSRIEYCNVLDTLRSRQLIISEDGEDGERKDGKGEEDHHLAHLSNNPTTSQQQHLLSKDGAFVTSYDSDINLLIDDKIACGIGAEEGLSSPDDAPRDESPRGYGVIDDDVMTYETCASRPQRREIPSIVIIDAPPCEEDDEWSPDGSGGVHQGACVVEAKLPEPLVPFNKGLVCTDVWTALDILKTQYKLPDVSRRKHVITFSCWNIRDLLLSPSHCVHNQCGTSGIDETDDLIDLLEVIVRKEKEIDDLVENVLEQERQAKVGAGKEKGAIRKFTAINGGPNTTSLPESLILIKPCSDNLVHDEYDDGEGEGTSSEGNESSEKKNEKKTKKKADEEGGRGQGKSDAQETGVGKERRKRKNPFSRMMHALRKRMGRGRSRA